MRLLLGLQSLVSGLLSATSISPSPSPLLIDRTNLPLGSLCRALPGDPSWPSPAVWTAFNASVDGRLIRTVPIAMPCHAGPAFDQAQCDYIRANWHETDFHLPSSSSIMTPFFANKSCDPFTAPSDQCVIGAYVQYAVNISTTAHVAKTIAFAKAHNIRFVIRNTGHDYMGKSTGTGAISVWMHYLQDAVWIDDYRSSSYHGPAVKASAGVSVDQMYALADKHNHVVVGGDCRTVGFAGGYIQGGGHSTLSSLFGMAADSALEYEVVTMSGDVITASPTQNSDLYWALSGGGGGSYAVVWSVTVKAHPNFPVTIASIDFTPENITDNVYWEGIAAFQAVTPSLTDAGAYAITIYGPSFFSMGPLFAPNQSVAQINALLEPTLTKLTALGINYDYSINLYPSFQSAFDSVQGFVKFEIGTLTFGGRILPKSLWQNPHSLNQMMGVLRQVANSAGQEGMLYDVILSPPVRPPASPPNAVLPAWREAQKFIITLLPWNDTATDAEISATRNRVTNVLDTPLRNLAPNSGTYLNEADSDEPNWQQSFYGSNYARLLQIKDKYDPDQFLYGSTAVGGDRWKEDHEGRLCRT